MRVSRRALLLTAASAPLARVPSAAAGAVEHAGIVCPLAAAPPVLVPGLWAGFATRFLGGKIYRGLMRWDAGGTMQPDLAAAAEVSEDGLTYTFRLRPGITWHDGGGFDAADVVFSLARFHPALQPRLRLDRIRSIEAPDTLTVRLTLAVPNPAFLRQLDALCLPIVPQHVHDRPGWALDPREVAPVGTGAFRVAEWLRLVRFDWYVGPPASLADIQCPILPDAQRRLERVEPGSGVLLAGDSVDWPAIPRLRATEGVVLDADMSGAATAIAGLRLNVSAKPLDQVEVRRALACAVDRQSVLRTAWLGLGRVAVGPVCAGSSGRDPAITLPEYSLQEAAGLLNAAGLRPDDTGIRVGLSYLQPPGGPWHALFAVMRPSLGRIGIELTAEPVSAPEWARRVAAGEYQVTGFSAAQSGDPAVDLAEYQPAVPALAALLPGGEDGAKQAQALLVAHMPVVWLVEPAIPVIRDKRLHLPDGVLGSFAGASLD